MSYRPPRRDPDDYYDPYTHTYGRPRRGPPPLCWKPRSADLYSFSRHDIIMDGFKSTTTLAIDTILFHKGRDRSYAMEPQVLRVSEELYFRHLDGASFILLNFDNLLPLVVGEWDRRFASVKWCDDATKAAWREELVTTFKSGLTKLLAYCFRRILELVPRARFLSNIHETIVGLLHMYGAELFSFKYVRKSDDLYVPNGHWVRQFLTSVQARLPDLESQLPSLRSRSDETTRTATYRRSAFESYRSSTTASGLTRQQEYFDREDLRYGECAGPEPLCDYYEQQEREADRAHMSSLRATGDYADCEWTIRWIRSTMTAPAPAPAPSRPAQSGSPAPRDGSAAAGGR